MWPTRPLTRRIRRRGFHDVLVASAVPLALLLAMYALGLHGYRLNLSPSMPMGVWRATPYIEDALFVEACLPERFKALAVERGYLGPADCAGLAALLKPLVARAGDVVELTDEAVLVNGRPIPGTATRAVDRLGRALPRQPRGVRIVGDDELWLVSAHHPFSFDSRYFGPVSRESVRASLTPVWVW